MFQVLLACPVVYNNIIKEHQQEFLQLLIENVVHAILECRWCIGQSKWHDEELIISIVAPESSLRDILLSEFDLMISISDINLQKIHYSMQLIQNIIDPRDRVHVLDCLLICIPVVDAHPHGSILLLEQDN
jgi:hypothetical protein